MRTLIAYDISDHRARRKFFAFLREKGLHTQKSVFECELGAGDVAEVLRVAAALDMRPQDSVVLWPLCRRCAQGAVILGRGIGLARTSWMVI